MDESSKILKKVRRCNFETYPGKVPLNRSSMEQKTVIIPQNSTSLFGAPLYINSESSRIKIYPFLSLRMSKRLSKY